MKFNNSVRLKTKQTKKMPQLCFSAFKVIGNSRGLDKLTKFIQLVTGRASTEPNQQPWTRL